MNVHFHLKASPVHVVSARIDSALGAPLRAEIEVSSVEPLDGAALVGTTARIEVTGGDASVALHHGIVASITAVATTDPKAQRRYVVLVRSAIEWLELRKNARVFRKKTAVAIVKEVLAGGGIKDKAFVNEVGEEPPEREYTTQWNETDAVFLRRICEEEGLFFRFDPKDGFDAFVLCDRSGDAPDELGKPLLFVDVAGLRDHPIAAFNPSHLRRRKVGKVALRDYDPARPALKLEATLEGGIDAEKSVEVYEAPGGFRSASAGQRSARLRLEALRAEADTLAFDTTAALLRPGVSFEADTNLAAGAVPAGKYFVVETTLRWEFGREDGALAVRSIPLAVPYRLPRTTARPRIPGMLNATVTGAGGEEIHTDAGGHVRVHFPWDREGPSNEKASLPVRVMQANLPGSMLVPRVGWEVVVGFEDGDPDRPFVLGRSFNGKQLPPFGLPANKTITSLGTVSSPGGGRTNRVHIDDGAGRQHMVWNAGFGKTTQVAANMVNQTVGFETTTITGHQTWKVTGDQTISIENASTSAVGSQTATVSGNQTLTLKATGATTVGTETVLVGGALVEQVGDPVAGFAEFGKAAVLAGVGEIPAIGPVLTKGYTWGSAVYKGYKQGGFAGAARAAGQEAVNEVASHLPGADAVVAGVEGAGLSPFTEKSQERAAQQQAGGGAAGPGAAAAGAAAAAPGHRKLVVDGTVTELIGAVHGIETPGSLKWTTLGASTFLIGGSHATSAARVSRLTMARSSDTAAATSITARASIGRNVKSAHTLKAGGALKVDAGGEVGIKAEGALSLQVSGAASFEGGTVVFEVGGSSLSVHGGGVTLVSPAITINGKNQHSGKETTG